MHAAHAYAFMEPQTALLYDAHSRSVPQRQAPGRAAYPNQFAPAIPVCAPGSAILTQ